MHYQHLANFISSRLRENDTYIPSMILFLVKNSGWGTKEQIAKLIYIFEYKYSLKEYEVIVDKFASTILEDYNIIKKEDDIYKLRTWPLSDSEIDSITKECYKVANGFFSNLHNTHKEHKKAS